jgi:hypothetical protein
MMEAACTSVNFINIYQSIQKTAICILAAVRNSNSILVAIFRVCVLVGLPNTSSQYAFTLKMAIALFVETYNLQHLMWLMPEY